MTASRKLLLGLHLALAISSGDALAIEVPPHIATEITDAHLFGQGKFRWFGFKIYDAQLWVSKQGFNPTMPSAEKFALDLRYARAFPGKKIAESGIHEIEKLGFGSPQQHQAWLQQMESCFPDVSDGTHLTGIFEPGQGVNFYLDGKKICTIPDSEFSTAFFAIWLDPRTKESKLRKELLGAVSPD